MLGVDVDIMESKNSHIIELRAVEKSFGSQKVLDRIDLAVETGKTTVIIGRSGTGKSVLLKHIICLLRPDAGEVFFGGAIGLISCYKGFHCARGASGVARACTEGFVLNFIAILVLDLFLSVLLGAIYTSIWGTVSFG